MSSRITTVELKSCTSTSPLLNTSTNMNTPGAPDLSQDTSGPFDFESPFSPYQYPSFDEAEWSILSGTSGSANSSLWVPTPGNTDPRLAHSYGRTPHHRNNASLLENGTGSSSASAMVGLGFIGMFKQDGTPLDAVGSISRDDSDEEDDENSYEYDHECEYGYEELPSFMDDFSPEQAVFMFDDDELRESQDQAPVPRLLDDVFSLLAVTKSPQKSSSVGSCGPEEPEHDDVFLERGRAVGKRRGE